MAVRKFHQPDNLSRITREHDSAGPWRVKSGPVLAVPGGHIGDIVSANDLTEPRKQIRIHNDERN